jgi:hypothetical protein
VGFPLHFIKPGCVFNPACSNQVLSYRILTEAVNKFFLIPIPLGSGIIKDENGTVSGSVTNLI